VDSYSDIPQSVLLKLKSTQDRSCSSDSETECCPSSRSGMMYAPLTGNLGEEQLMLFAEDSHAKTSVQREKELVLEESVRDYGKSMPELLTKYGLSLSLRKTPRYCGVAGLTLFSETCPSWGIMQDGACWELGTSARPTRETECGYLPKLAPTPRAQEPGSTSEGYGDCLNDVVKGRKGWDKMWPTPDANMGKRGTQPNWTRLRKSGHTAQYTINQAVRDSMWPTPQSAKEENGGKLNPVWVEWLMGWPMEWTDLKPLETGKYQQWQQQHGEYFHNKH